MEHKEIDHQIVREANIMKITRSYRKLQISLNKNLSLCQKTYGDEFSSSSSSSLSLQLEGGKSINEREYDDSNT